MAAAYGGGYEDSSAAARFGYGANHYGEYGARQAAQARQYASATPYEYLRPESRGSFYQGRGHKNTSASTLPEDSEVRATRGRHRSLPPPGPSSSKRPSRRRRSPSVSSSLRSEDPIRRAHGLFKETFSNTHSGVGVGILGAVVGGLLAREASEVNSRSRSHARRHHESERARLISTVLGAAIGGFGANAVEKKIQAAREKTAGRHRAPEKRSHRSSTGRRVDDTDCELAEDARGRARDRRNRRTARDLAPR